MKQRNISVTSHFGTYVVEILSVMNDIEYKTQGKSAHYVIDSGIWKAYQKKLSFVKRGSSVYIYPSLERHKTIFGISQYLDFLLANNILKNHVIVVIGGGLVQDIGSFTAHILKRGMSWVFVPTTLLSMADSCIGSKSGINVGKYKNQIGAFHPPSAIYIYPPFLDTLPKSDIQNGCGEIIKHAIIKGGKIFSLLTSNIQSIPANTIKTKEIIFQSLLVKKEIVEEDEFDLGRRKLLNYGHTFGHALEGYTKNAIPHGIAVTIGMDMANYISLKRGYLSQNDFENISTLLHKNIPIHVLPIKRFDLYMDYLHHDKKVINNEVDALLCRGVGKVEIMRVKLDAQLKKEIEEYCNYFALKRKTLPALL